LGVAVDSVIEMQMVDANGKLLVVNTKKNRDLFWALLGGGGGNFGIVTKFIIKVYDAPNSIIFGRYEYSFKKDFIPVFKAWQKAITSNLPNHIFCIINMEKDRLSMRLYAINMPGKKQETLTTIGELGRKLGFPEPSNGSIKSYTQEEFTIDQAKGYSKEPITSVAQVAQLTKHNTVYNKKVKSYFVGKILNDREINQLKNLLDVYLPHAGQIWEHGGGAIDKNPGNSFNHRGSGAKYSVQLKPLNSQGQLKTLETDAAKIRFFEASKNLFRHTESYQNYLDREMEDYLQRYYGKDLKKLIKVKKQYDPANVFYHCESIPTRRGAPRICDMSII